MKQLIFLILGIIFGITLTKAEVISWFRIQEMFRFQGFYMFGVLMTAIATAMIGVQFIRKFQIRTISKEPIVLPEKRFHKGVVIGGIIFGLGWSLTGVCPGPMYAQIGAGVGVTIVTLLSALVGTWVYCYLRPHLPH